MEEFEKNAYLHGGTQGGAFLESIRKTDLSQLSEYEWLTFLECVCKAYHEDYIKNMPCPF